MKKALIIFWFVALVAILSFVIRQSFVKKAPHTPEPDNAKGGIYAQFNHKTLDSLLLQSSYVFLSIGSHGCDYCDMLLSSKEPNKFPVARYFIEIESDKNNLLASQALRTRGFPTSYIIDQQYNVVGIIRGLVRLEEQLNRIINLHDTTCIDTIPGVSAQNTLPMLSHAFRSLLAHMDGNKDEMYAQAQKSLKYGSYFFNSYLLYKYHSNGSRKYSTDHYRNEALKYAHDVDILIYESLIKELDSNNPEVQHMRLHNHNHAIEQEKVRQNKSTLKSSYMIEL